MTPISARNPVSPRWAERARSCGWALAAVIALTVAAGAARSAPAPVALDPAIQSLIAQVSEDSLRSYVQTLQDFTTRHSASDTVSTTSGIGAARRWLHARFGANAGVSPSYYLWDTEFCTSTGERRNVLGTLTGSTYPDRIFMVGAHLDSRNAAACDSVGFAPGANDDGSGIANLMEIVRLLSTLNVESTVIVQGFSGEEQSLLGSEAYAQQAASEGRDIVAMLANDIIGNVDGCPGVPDCGQGLPTDMDSTTMRVFSGGLQNSSSRQLARYVKFVGEGYVNSMTVSMIAAIDRPNRGSDHISFFDVGYAAVRCMESLEYTLQQHNEFDLIEEMEFPYHRRNVMINLAVIANLALAPPTPTGLQVFDLGTGGGIRVQWDPLLGAGDVAGYRVAYRLNSALNYVDILDAGTATTLDITGLTNEATLAVSVSAYDALGHESLFSQEKTVTPGVTPHLIRNFTVSSLTDQIDLDWSLPQELDLDRIRIYRSIQETTGFAPYDSVAPGQTAYADLGALPGQVYYYKANSVDLGGLESPLTAVDRGLRATYEPGILVVDATKDAFGTPGFPTDALVDNYYAALLSGAPVLGNWDLKANLDLGILLTDAEMAQYKTVWIHSDVRAGRLEADTLEIRQYLENGGQIFLSAWGLQETIEDEVVAVGNYGPGDFFYDVLHVGIVATTELAQADCIGATSLVAEYSDLDLDPVKWPHSDGHLVIMDVFVDGVLPSATPIYAYESSFLPPGPMHGLPVGLKVGGPEASLIFIDQPLYFMRQATAQACVDQALLDFGYGVAAIPTGAAAHRLQLRAQPNPFSGATDLSFELATGTDAVKLSIFDVEGRLVRTLADGKLEAGPHRFEWDGRNNKGDPVGSSVYYGVLQAGELRVSRQITVLR